jgi:hypothetical protein
MLRQVVIVAANLEFSYNAYNKKKILTAAQWSGRVKISFSEQQQVRAAVENIRGNVESN